MRDSESNLLKFAKIVEKYPLLYFISSYAELGYLWETVASSVRLEIREECTVEELKHKWKSMRAKYLAYGKQLSQGGKLRKQQQYDLYNTLAFLYPSAAERYTYLLKCPPPVLCYTDDSRIGTGKSKLKTTGKTSIKTYGNTKDTSAVDHHLAGEPDNLGQSNRSDDLVQNTTTEESKQCTRSNELGQGTGSGNIGLHTEECSTAIKDEALWNLTEDPTSSDSDSDVKPNFMESVTLVNVDNFPDDMTESTSFDVHETGGNIDLQFFKSILPDIGNFTPQEKRRFKIGVLKLIDEIEENRK